MNDMQSFVEIGRDLQKKCAMDTIDLISRATQLCDNHAQATFVACGAVTGSLGVVVAHLMNKDAFYNLEPEELHDVTIFAALFVWTIDGVNNGLENELPLLIKKWESFTGRKFKMEWLIEPMAKIASGKYAKAAS